MTLSKIGQSYLFHIFLLLSICLVFIYYSWVGYIGSDDWVYIENARARIAEPFMIGQDHWQVRLPLTWPMALSFLALGESELAAALPTLLYFVALVLLNYLLISKVKDRQTALLSSTLLATSPLLLVNATSLRVDTVETFWVIASLLIFYLSVYKNGNGLLLVLVGITAGISFVTRPTVVGLLVYYFILFASGYGKNRSQYMLILLGFILIWGTETIYYWMNTGTPLYRFHLDYHHDTIDRSKTSNFGVFLDPIFLLLFNQGFGILFWLLPFASYGLLRSPDLKSKPRLDYFLLGFVITWLLFVFLLTRKLVLDARYLAPATVAALILVASWLSLMCSQGKRYMAGLLFSGIILTNIVCLYLENKNPIYAERWLVELAKLSTEPIYTDPQTEERARFLLELDNTATKVHPLVAPPGSLFLSVPINAARGQYNAYRWNASDFAPGNWQIVDKLNPENRIIARPFEWFGLDKLVPSNFYKKICCPNSPIILYRNDGNGVK